MGATEPWKLSATCFGRPPACPSGPRTATLPSSPSSSLRLLPLVVAMPPDQLTKQQLVDYLCHHLEESDVVYSVFRLQQMKAAGLLEPWTGMEGLLTNRASRHSILKSSSNYADPLRLRRRPDSWKRHSPLVEAVIHPDSLLRRMLFDLVFSFIPDPKATIAYQVAKDNGMSWAVKRMESWAREGQRRGTYRRAPRLGTHADFNMRTTAHTAKRLFNLPMDKVVDWVQQQRNVPPQHELTQNGPLPPRPAALYAPASDQSAARTNDAPPAPRPPPPPIPVLSLLSPSPESQSLPTPSPALPAPAQPTNVGPRVGTSGSDISSQDKALRQVRLSIKASKVSPKN